MGRRPGLQLDVWRFPPFPDHCYGKRKSAPEPEIGELLGLVLPAIGSRGARKDFIDLFAIVERVLPLPELFKLLPQKYGQRANYLHLWKGLTFGADADLDTNYPGWKGAKWSNIKQFFRQEAYKIKLLVDQS